MEYVVLILLTKSQIERQWYLVHDGNLTHDSEFRIQQIGALMKSI
jgi:hypothetical protein